MSYTLPPLPPTIAKDNRILYEWLHEIYKTSIDITSTDADLLDGLDSTQFLRSDINDTFTGTTLTVQSLLNVGEITIDGINNFVTAERYAVRKDTNTTWPAAVLDNFSTGTAAEIAINFRKHNASSVQLGFNITLGFGDTPNGGELNIESTDSVGAVRASPFSLTQDGRSRLGGFVAAASYGSNVRNLIASGVSTDKILVVRGITSQSGNLQEWQNSSQASLGFITSGGDLAVGGINQSSIGAIRLPNNAAIAARNGANTSDLNIIFGNSADQIALGTGADIRWGVALVALGGGAAPTLGTIGGSGPATAAQNTWMRVIDSTGATFWVAAWK